VDVRIIRHVLGGIRGRSAVERFEFIPVDLDNQGELYRWPRTNVCNERLGATMLCIPTNRSVMTLCPTFQIALLDNPGFEAVDSPDSHGTNNRFLTKSLFSSPFAEMFHESESRD
jgi:hypothetical protein